MTSYLLWGFCTFFSIAWIGFYLQTLITVYSTPLFEKVPIPENSAPLPKLSIVVAACNEKQTLQQALPTLLNQDYPDFEVIVVNDRSTDGTGTLLNNIAITQPKLKVIHIDDLPPKWLGKVYALKRGSEIAKGQWILFTDADIHLSKDTLKRAVQYTRSENNDHLALLPNIISHSFFYSIILSAFSFLFLSSIKANTLKNADNQTAVGIGAFNLVRTQILDKSSAFNWLRMEVCDDLGLALAIKNAGGKSSFAFARKHVSLHWYNSIAAMFKGLEKNLFSASSGYQPLRLIVIFLSMWCLVLAPFASLFINAVPYLWLTGAVALTVFLISISLVCWRTKTAFLTSVLNPVGILVISLMLLNSGIQCMNRGGIIWRGTFYPIDILKKSRRVGFNKHKLNRQQ